MTWANCGIPEKPEVSYTGSGKSGNTQGKQPGVSGELQGPWRVDSPRTAQRASALCWQSLWPGRSCSMALELTPDCSRALFSFVEKNDILEAESWNGNNTQVLEISRGIE